ncbi:hypothetical protein GCM10009676_23070 [Prauserella halophila]|uniref:Uncharacterized protein n=1 Tax=Prauserella halophila TaxID=185641 RepID=A0ABN1W6Q6_9PSEU
MTIETGTTATTTPTITGSAPAWTVTRPKTISPQIATATMPVTGTSTVTRRVMFRRACRTTVAGPFTPRRVVAAPDYPAEGYGAAATVSSR